MRGAIAWFVDNPVAANLLMGLIVIGGLVALPNVQQKTMPDMDIDIVEVSVEYLGAAPEEVETGVCIRIEEAIAGIERRSEHWLTNTALGATTAGVDVSGEVGEISAQAAACVGGDIVAVDLLECPNRGLLVNEINHSMEFRNSIEITGVNIPRLVAEHVSRIAAGELV